MTWTPWHFLVVAIAGWMNREQQQVIDYLREENRTCPYEFRSGPDHAPRLGLPARQHRRYHAFS
jgi:hypothetical protein